MPDAAGRTDTATGFLKRQVAGFNLKLRHTALRATRASSNQRPDRGLLGLPDLIALRPSTLGVDESSAPLRSMMS